MLYLQDIDILLTELYADIFINFVPLWCWTCCACSWRCTFLHTAGSIVLISRLPLALVSSLIWQRWSYLQVQEGALCHASALSCLSIIQKVRVFVSIQRTISELSDHLAGCFWSCLAPSQLSMITLWFLIEFKAHLTIRIQSNHSESLGETLVLI